MLSIVRKWLIGSGIGEGLAEQVTYVILAVGVLLLCVFSHYLTRKLAVGLTARHIRNSKVKWDDVLLESGVFRRLSHIIPVTIIRLTSPYFGPYTEIIRKGAGLYLAFVTLMVIDAALNAVDTLYRRHEISKTRPIKGYLQVLKIAAFIIGGIVVIADLMGESPLVMLSGIGALTAVFSLVFKDSILGLVAGIQLSANDMIRIGDWIEIPQYSADGDVIDISLNTVKIQNFDNTITTVPAYALISDSFKNWRGMKSSGARRIMRAVNIDVSSISFCNARMLEKLKKSNLLKDYIETRQAEINEYNKSHELDPAGTVNARRLTNIGIFRVYILNYLKNHPGIQKDMIQMVRQLPPGDNGIPLQIYVFANTTDWVVFENTQSDIFDHILSVVDMFELRIFQNPSGYDLTKTNKL